jgi:hypothetical protein
MNIIILMLDICLFSLSIQTHEIRLMADEKKKANRENHPSVRRTAGRRGLPSRRRRRLILTIHSPHRKKIGSFLSCFYPSALIYLSIHNHQITKLCNNQNNKNI